MSILESTQPVVTAEVAAVLRLLERRGADTIGIGSARDGGSLATRAAIAASWVARGGVVVGTVDWPETAASWLRQAQRLAALAPDVWVVCARPRGWGGMVGRLAGTGWTARRTIVTASLAGRDVLAGGAIDGLCGVTRDGRAWRVGRGAPPAATGAGGAGL